MSIGRGSIGRMVTGRGSSYKVAGGVIVSVTGARAYATAGELYGPSSYAPATPTNFADGFLKRTSALTGAVNGKKGIVSIWIRRSTTIDTAQRVLSEQDSGGSTESFALFFRASNVIALDFKNTGGTFSLGIESDIAITDQDWHHYLMAWDTTSPGAAWLYVDDVDRTIINLITADDTLLYTDTHWRVGRKDDAGAIKFDGDIGTEFYLNLAETIDPTVTANRRKFTAAGGEPVSLGSDGSTPTGTAPAIYLKNETATFEVNAGAGGDFTQQSTLATASDDLPVVGQVTGGASLTLDQALGTGQIGSLALTGGALVLPTGISADGLVGAVVITGGATASPAGVTAVSAVGSVVVTGGALVILDQALGTGQVGEVTVSTGGDVSVSIAGVLSTGAAGTPTVSGAALVLPSGVASAGSVGVMVVTGAAGVGITGVSAEGRAGTIGVVGGATVTLSGVSATGQIGTVTIITTTGGDVIVVLTGASATGAAGTPTITGDALVQISQALATGTVGTAIVVQAGPGKRVLIVRADERGLIVEADSRVRIVRGDDDTVH